MGNEFDTHLLPLLRRMLNLEELTLKILNNKRASFIDGAQINDGILVHMPRLRQFTFHISTETRLEHLVHYYSKEDIQQTFTNIGYEQVDCVLSYYYILGVCHVFSLPFMFDTLYDIGNTFPPFIFPCVTKLSVHDIVPFEHEFFVRIARFFPLLKDLRFSNSDFYSHMLNKSNPNDNELCVIVEYPHLVSLSLLSCRTYYIEQFLNETKTRLPCLTKLRVDYRQLTIVTEDFTRDSTRLNCTKVKELILEQPLVHSKDFYDYFPLL